ncbi:MAG TPA: hypothetical protein VN798_05035, partial [Pseudomonas sp.]|nr:hypothetical protein [Pseudomonas sp.]
SVGQGRGARPVMGSPHVAQPLAHRSQSTISAFVNDGFLLAERMAITPIAIRSRAGASNVDTEKNGTAK